MKRILVFGIVGIWFLTFAHATNAHAIPTTHQIQTNGTNTTISIDFSEKIEPTGSGIHAYNDQGVEIPTKNLLAQNKTLSAAISADTNLARITWYVTSRDDGHFTRGGYVIPNTQSSTTNNLAPASIDHSVSLAEAAALWAELVGASILLGIYALWFVVHQTSALKESSKKAWNTKQKWWAVASMTIATTGTAGLVIYKAWTLKAAANLATLSQGIGSVLHTTSGQSTLVRAILFLISTGVAISISSRKIQTTLKMIVPLTIAAIVLRSVASHAFASGFYPTFSVAITTIHLLTKELLIGTIIAFVFLVPTILKEITTEHQTKIITRLNKLNAICIALAGITGAYIIWLDLKDIQNIFITAWGRECIALTATAILLLIVRYINQYSSRRTFKSFKLLQQGYLLPLEAALGLAVLAATALIIITSPPQQALPITQTKRSITVGSDPFRTNTIKITVPQQSTRIEAEVLDPTDSQNTIPLPITHIAPHTVVAPYPTDSHNQELSLKITAHIPNEYDIIETFAVAADGANKTPKFSFQFAIICIAAALTLLGIGSGLYKTAHNNDNPQLDALITEQAWFFWFIVVGIFAYSFLGTHGGHSGLVKSAFERVCRKDGFTWQEAIPTYNGIPNGTNLFLGCSGTKNSILFHIPNYDEYVYSMKSQ